VQKNKWKGKLLPLEWLTVS